jgi:hypothetical protein
MEKQYIVLGRIHSHSNSSEFEEPEGRSHKNAWYLENEAAVIAFLNNNYVRGVEVLEVKAPTKPSFKLADELNNCFVKTSVAWADSLYNQYIATEIVIKNILEKVGKKKHDVMSEKYTFEGWIDETNRRRSAVLAEVQRNSSNRDTDS